MNAKLYLFISPTKVFLFDNIRGLSFYTNLFFVPHKVGNHNDHQTKPHNKAIMAVYTQLLAWFSLYAAHPFVFSLSKSKQPTNQLTPLSQKVLTTPPLSPLTTTKPPSSPSPHPPPPPLQQQQQHKHKCRKGRLWK